MAVKIPLKSVALRRSETMNTYLAKLTPSSPIITPLHSGILFGHLCWAYRYLYGDAKLTQWLASLQQQPLLALIKKGLRFNKIRYHLQIRSTF